jgi:hypothetical protein
MSKNNDEPKKLPHEDCLECQLTRVTLGIALRFNFFYYYYKILLILLFTNIVISGYFFWQTKHYPKNAKFLKVLSVTTAMATIGFGIIPMITNFKTLKRKKI